jgi:hypothetical protein
VKQPVRTLNSSNIASITRAFEEDLATIGASIKGKTGLPLLVALKREALTKGPYTGVSLFEAANRIMSDLVILRGVAGLLKDSTFKFSEYTVEFGNEDNNGFDMRAKFGSQALVGEAFNVAPSFFQIKKSSALKKLTEKAPKGAARLVMYNADAVANNYAPRVKSGFVHVAVNIETGQLSVWRASAA